MLLLAAALLAVPCELAPVFEAEVARAGAAGMRAELAAQIHRESSWRPRARSRYASGLAQFTPPTWSDIAPLTAPRCDGTDPTDPGCAIRAQIVYMRRLLARYRFDREPWEFSWAAYNGGPGWIAREKSRCRREPGCDPRRWTGHVERHCIRAAWACAENRAYPAKVGGLVPLYREGGCR